MRASKRRFCSLSLDLQPDLDELDAAVHDVFLDLGTEFKKAGVLFLRAKAHHIFHASAVVPTAVEDHDLARRREMRHVTLHIHLRLLAVGRRRQRDESEDPRADPLGERPDGAALARGVAAFEDDDDAQPLLLDPILEMTQLGLKLAKFLSYFFAFIFSGPFGFDSLLIGCGWGFVSQG